MATIRPYLPPPAPLTGRAPARPEPAPVEALQRVTPRFADNAAREEAPRRVESRTPDRLPRPGSLLDIRV